MPRSDRLALLLCAILPGAALGQSKAPAAAAKTPAAVAPAKPAKQSAAKSASKGASAKKQPKAAKQPKATAKPSKKTAPDPSPAPAEPDPAAASSSPAGGAPAATGGEKQPQAFSSAAPAGALAQTAEEQLDLRVKTLEERVNELKEKIFRTKARLLNLQEMVIGGDVTSGAKAVLVHRNEMGSSFVLESVAYALDGAPIYSKVDVDGDLEKRDEFEIFNGRIVPGNHQIGVKLVYRGHGYGLFSYLEGYKFKVQSSYTFNAEAGKVAVIKVVGMERGGITTELKDRPAVRYDVDVRKEEPLKKGAPGASHAPAPAPTPEATPAAAPAAAPANVEAGSNGK